MMGKGFLTSWRVLVCGLSCLALSFLVFVAFGASASFADSSLLQKNYDLVPLQERYAGEENGKRIGSLQFDTRYLSQSERAQYAIHFVGEGSAAKWVDVAGNPLTGNFMFVMDRDGIFYAGKQELGRFHHSSFLAGQPVAGAGEMEFEQGKLLSTAKNSGHYRPNQMFENQVLLELHRKGVELEKVSHSYSKLSGHPLPGDQELSSSELFRAYRDLREGSYTQAKEAVVRLSGSNRGRSLLRSEFDEMIQIESAERQIRYAQLVEDLFPHDDKLKALGVGRRGSIWDASEDYVRQRLKKWWAVQKALPVNSANLDILLFSLDDSFSSKSTALRLAPAISHPDLAEFRAALLKRANPKKAFAAGMQEYRAAQPGCLLPHLQNAMNATGAVQ